MKPASHYICERKFCKWINKKSRYCLHLQENPSTVTTQPSFPPHHIRIISLRLCHDGFASDELKNDTEGIAMSVTYGYVRISSKDQNETRQLIAMREAGAEDGNLFLDKHSGKDFDRLRCRRLLGKLKAGDLLIVKSIDRLSRNYDEIKEQWRVITKEKRADILVLDMPLLDTRREMRLDRHADPPDIVLELLPYVVKKERGFIRQRQTEGIAAAKKRGVRFGAPLLERAKNLANYMQQWSNGYISAKEGGRKLGVSHDTFIKWAKETLSTNVTER